MVFVGVDYYPEHWSESQWDKDIELMVKTGVYAVRIGEFAWSRLQPSENVFNFDWLDKIIQKLTDNGLKIIMCTPTNCAPLWMYRNYPETLQVDRDGTKTKTGIRGHRCYNSPIFRKFAEQIIEKECLRYKSNNNIIAWQIDNELPSNVCNCENCRAQFINYLKEKYKNVTNLNESWKNDVWSGDFSNFEEINTPLGDNYLYNWLNPSYLAEFETYASQSTEQFVEFQKKIIRKHFKYVKITTNACFSGSTPDYFKLFDNLDVASYDNYPALGEPKDGKYNRKQSFILDMVRGFKNQNYWIMEQMGGAFGCWAPISPTPQLGMISGYAMQAVAHGGDAIMFFRWRTAIGGAETFCHGLIDHSMIEGRRFKEFADFCNKINQLHISCQSKVFSRVAVVFSFKQERAFRIQRMNETFDYFNYCQSFHEVFKELGLNVDVISDLKEIQNYDVVILPAYFMINEEEIEYLKDFSASGGTLVATMHTAVKNEYNVCYTTPLPAYITELFGCFVKEYDSVSRPVAVVMDGEKYNAGNWCDILSITDGKVLATYAEQFYKGEPAAVIKNNFVYLGSEFSKDFLKKVIKGLLNDKNIPYEQNLPEGVDVSIRETEQLKYIFIFNNNDKQVCFEYLNEQICLSPFQTKEIIVKK